MNGDGREFASALIKMATSPVKADREAIARIERECSANITDVTTLLEEFEILCYSTKPKSQRKLTILASGFFWSGIVGIAVIFIRPTFVWEAVTLGFVAGGAHQIVKEKH